MKRDLYAEVSARIVAELLEAGAAPWVKPWSATPGANTPCNAMSNRPYSGCNVVLLWMAQAAGYRTPRFLTFKQALELGGNVRKGERGTKVYFVKQLKVCDQSADDSSSTRLIPMMREYTVFNVDQCEKLPDSINTGKPMRVRNPDTRDELADAFLHSTGADILLPFCYPIRWQRTTQADIGWIGVAKISKDNSTLRNWPLQVEMAGAAFRVRCIQPLYILQWMIRALGSS
jgi:antirestriction protein ArdC